MNGAGILNDSFAIMRGATSATHRPRRTAGVPAALVGQGIGPIDSLRCDAARADVLPRAELIAVRESQASVPILESLGVDLRASSSPATMRSSWRWIARIDALAGAGARGRRQRARRVVYAGVDAGGSRRC